MSDYQREHAAEIEHLVPNLVNLRQKISGQISHGKFWMIYFTLLFSRLNEEDLKLLATPEARFYPYYDALCEILVSL